MVGALTIWIKPWALFVIFMESIYDHHKYKGRFSILYEMITNMYTEQFGMTPEGHFLTSESINIIMIIKNIYHIW